MNNVVYVKNLTFSYGRNLVLKEISFVVRSGSITALLGPNGSGKTTILFILMGLLKWKDGTVKVFDMDPWRDGNIVKKKVGFVYEQPTFYNNLTMLDNLILTGNLHNIEATELINKINSLADILKVRDYLDYRPSELSQGYRQRFAIAEALLSNPELLILDEPTTGIDMETMIILHRLLIELNRDKKTTILISSHNLYLLEKVADYFIFLKNGKILRGGWKEELLGGDYIDHYIVEVGSLPNLVKTEILKNFGTTIWDEDNKTYIKIGSDDLVYFINFLQEKNAIIKNIRPLNTTLEELYLNICSDEDG